MKITIGNGRLLSVVSWGGGTAFRLLSIEEKKIKRGREGNIFCIRTGEGIVWLPPPPERDFHLRTSGGKGPLTTAQPPPQPNIFSTKGGHLQGSLMIPEVARIPNHDFGDGSDHCGQATLPDASHHLPRPLLPTILGVTPFWGR